MDEKKESSEKTKHKETEEYYGNWRHRNLNLYLYRSDFKKYRVHWKEKLD
jgi:hypothetical protein